VLTNLPETLKNVQHHLRIEWNKSVHNIIKAATLPGLRTIFPTVFLFWGGFTFFTTFFGVFLINKFGFQANNIGDFFAYIGIWIVLTQAVLTQRLAKYFSNWQVLRYSVFLMPIALLSLFWPHNTMELLMVAPLIPISVGLTNANSVALVSRSAPGNIQGEVLGINASVQALAQSIPAALVGYLGGISQNIPILVAAATVSLAGLVFWTLYKPSPMAKLDEANEMANLGH
jgi:predicted MFS family arabinose efflux permease